MIRFFIVFQRKHFIHDRSGTFSRLRNVGGGCDIGDFWLLFPCAAMLSAPDMKFQEARCLSEQYLPFSKETKWFLITVRQ